MSQITTEATPRLEWDLTDRLAKALRVSGVAKSDMAEHLGVGRNTVTNYLYGRTNPTTGTLRLWALRCGVPFDWLRDGTEPDNGPNGAGTQAIPPSGCVTAADNVIPFTMPRAA